MGFSFSYQHDYPDNKIDITASSSCRRLGLFGPSGSGKTSLVHFLAGIRRADRAYLEMDGVIYDQSEKGVRRPAEQRRLSMVFQQPTLFPHLSVEANCLYGFNRQPVNNRTISPKTIFEVMGLSSLLGRSINRLSGGEKQRVAMARAVLAHPKLLIFDEPLNGLDEEMKFTIMAYLNKLAEVVAIPWIFISHHLLEIQMMTDQVLEINQGKKVVQEATAAWIKRKSHSSGQGFLNIIQVSRIREQDSLYHYDWQGQSLVLVQRSRAEQALALLSSKDIMLFENHPGACSARNLFPATVQAIDEYLDRLLITLDWQGNRLVAEIVGPAAKELQLKSGKTVYAAIKASAFRIRG